MNSEKDTGIGGTKKDLIFRFECSYMPLNDLERVT